MLPLGLIKACIGKSILIELKNNETYNGQLVVCDTFMNIQLQKVICTSKDGDKFWSLPEVYIRGNTIKFVRIPDDIIEVIKEESKANTQYRSSFSTGDGRGGGSFNNSQYNRGGMQRGRGGYVARGARSREF